MAATYPSNEPDRDDQSTRPSLAAAPESTKTRRRPRWPWVVLGLVILAAVIAYFVLYGGGGGSGGGGGGGGYFILALPLERIARLIRARARRS